MITSNSKYRGAQTALTLMALGSFGALSNLAAEDSRAAVIQVSNSKSIKGARGFPGAIPTTINGRSLNILPEGGLLLSGRSSVAGKPDALQQTFLWRDENPIWVPVPQQGLGGDLSVSPISAQNLCVRGNDGFVSKDGGKSWQKGFSQFINIEGGRFQVSQSYWSTKEADTLFLSEMKIGSPCRLVKLDVNSGKMSLWSSTESNMTRYHEEGGKHFAWLGLPDTTPIKCVSSSDDGKTWSLFPVEQSPWALHASVQNNIGKLVNVNKTARMSVAWAFEINGTAFSRVESLVGEKIPANTPTVFMSSDQGKTWKPIMLNHRDANIGTIFAESPFLSKSNVNLDPNSSMKVTIDKANNIVFASRNGEWFYTTPTEREWKRVNTSK
jgi:BNR/Asp-box repeat